MSECYAPASFENFKTSPLAWATNRAWHRIRTATSDLSPNFSTTRPADTTDGFAEVEKQVQARRLVLCAAKQGTAEQGTGQKGND
jgi:hypothetical protein